MSSGYCGQYEDEITFNCTEGLEFSPGGPDTITITCNSTGLWSDSVPTCQSMLTDYFTAIPGIRFLLAIVCNLTILLLYST